MVMIFSLRLVPGSRLVNKVGSKCDGKISKNDAAARPISHHCMPLGEAGNAVQQGPVIDEARHALTYIQRIKGKQVGMANRLAQHKGMKGCKARERSEERRVGKEGGSKGISRW